MKFKCEKTEEEYEAALSAKREKYGNWHRRFAWLPIRVDRGDCRVFEFVERRCEVMRDMSMPWWGVKYRSIK